MKVRQFILIKLLVCRTLCVSVGEIISLPWLSKELKNDLSKNNYLGCIIFILLVRESIFIGWEFSIFNSAVPRYKLSLCYTPIKPDLLDFPGVDIFACGLCDQVIWFQSLALLIRLYPSEIFVLVVSAKKKHFLSIQFLLLLDFVAYQEKKIKILFFFSFYYCPKYMSSIKKKKTIV